MALKALDQRLAGTPSRPSGSISINNQGQSAPADGEAAPQGGESAVNPVARGKDEVA